MRPEWLDKVEYARLREIGKQLLRSRGAPLRATFLDVAASAQWLSESLEKHGKSESDKRLMCRIHSNMCAMKLAPWEVAKTIVECVDSCQPQEPAHVDPHDNCINCNGSGWVGGVVGSACDVPVYAVKP